MLRLKFQGSVSPLVSQHGMHLLNCQYCQMKGHSPYVHKHHECVIKFQPNTEALQRRWPLFKECEETISHDRWITCTCSNDLIVVVIVTLFHLGCIQGKISLGLWKIQVRGQIISPGVLRHGWLFAFFVRQCCHLQADLHINPLHRRKRGASSLLLGPTIIWLLIIDWFNYSGSKTTVKPLDYGCLRQFNSVPYFAVYGQF